MKEVVLPFTGEQVWKVLLILGWTGIFTLPFLVHPFDHNLDSPYMGLYGLELSATLTCTIVVPMIYSWDMNPFHKIGYCIRLADNKITERSSE